jgi:tetratricopeptide (TPR) repeat protein
MSKADDLQKLAAWLDRGNAFFGLNRYDEALAAYDQALALRPDFAEPWLSLPDCDVSSFEMACEALGVKQRAG